MAIDDPALTGAAKSGRRVASKRGRDIPSTIAAAAYASGVPTASRTRRTLHHRRIFRRPRPLRHVLRPLLGDVHDVLVAHAELAVYVDPRLVRKAHPGDEAGL